MLSFLNWRVMQASAGLYNFSMAALAPGRPMGVLVLFYGKKAIFYYP